jgi:hypothetical protein
VRAPEDERVRAPVEDAREHRLQRGVRPRCVGVAVLDNGDEVGRDLAEHDDPRVGLLDGVNVLPARAGPLGAEHRDPAVARRRGRCLGSGGDHPHHGDVEAFARDVQRRRGCRVAGDHHELGVHSREQADDVQRETANLALRARAIGEMLQVRHVDERFRRHLMTDLAKHGQAADTGVEHADRARVAHALRRIAGGRVTPGPRGRGP